MLAIVWGIIGPIVINLAVTFGEPAAVAWIAKHIPWLPADVVDKIIKAIIDAIGGVHAVRADVTLSDAQKAIEIRNLKKDAHDTVAGHIEDLKS